MIERLHQLVDQALEKPPTRVAVAAAAHKLVLQSVQRAVSLGLIVPVLVGREEDVRQKAKAIGWDLHGVRLVSTETNKAAASASVELVRQGEADVVMHTDEMLQAVLRHDTGLLTDRLLSHVFVLEVPTYHKLLLISDAAININPEISAKAATAQNAVDLARRMGVDRPKVPALSSIETINPKIPSIVHAACLSKMAERGTDQERHCRWAAGVRHRHLGRGRKGEGPCESCGGRGRRCDRTEPGCWQHSFQEPGVPCRGQDGWHCRGRLGAGGSHVQVRPATGARILAGASGDAGLSCSRRILNHNKRSCIA